MKRVIDIDENVFTRLFDNGIQDNEIAIDDICEIARALRTGIPLEEELEKIKAEIELMDFDFGDYYDNTDKIIEMVSKVVDKHIAELKGENKQ